jgi:ABC-type multidrug transport system fused ATPase/permease subunit
MLKTVRRALVFMTRKERARYGLYLFLRAGLAFIDLFGIIAIGFLATSIALFITLGSDPNREIEIGNIAIPAVNAQTLPVVACLILLLFVGKAVIAVFLTRQLALFLAEIEARAAERVAGSAFGETISEARNHSKEEIYFAVQTGSPAAFNTLLNSAGTIVAEGILFCLVIGSFLLVNPLAALSALAYFGFIALAIQYFIGNKMEASSRIAAKEVVSANSAISNLIDVQREATLLGKKQIFLDKIHAARIRAASSNANQVVLSGMPRYIVESSLIVAIALFVLYQSLSGDIASSAATIGVFLSGGLRLTASLLPLQSALIGIKQSTPLAARALDLLASSKDRAEVNVHDSNQDKRTVEGVEVCLDNVSFSYYQNSEPVLKNLSLAIHAGQKVALIGASGSGKSTLADILLGLLKPSGGVVLLNDLSPEEMIGKFPGTLGYVPQNPGMVSGTIIENIALGVPASQIDFGRLTSAISAAHLNEVIDNLPEGLETDLGKHKDELSGGQLQRIGLARALYPEPKLLVLDEATSALDSKSEEEIRKALEEIRGTVTVLLVAHRLNTIQDCDIVFLMENGEITSSGSFQELLEKNRTVQELSELMTIDDPQ